MVSESASSGSALPVSDAAQARIDEAIARYPEPRGALLPALHIVHEELGYVSPHTARSVAAYFGIRAIEVMEVVSFYNMFHEEPQGRHRVYVCTNLSCSLRGARDLLRQVEAHLGVRSGQTTPDDRITLRHDECLSACDNAPMLRVGDIYHENLDVEQAKRILDALE